MRFKLFNGRNRFYQWDVNQKLIVLDYDPNCQIHFKSPGERCSLLVKPYVLNGQTVIDVPNKILQDSGSVVIYAYYYKDEKYTKQNFVFDIVKRQKPVNYVYTEDEVLTWEAFDERLQNIEENGISEDVIESTLKEYLEENKIETGATAEQAAQIEQNKRDIAELRETVGEDGATFIPNVSEDGIISWTNDKELENPDPVNIKGEDGGYYTPNVDASGNLSWEASKEDMFHITGQNIKGEKGEDGTSVTITAIEQSLQNGGNNVVYFSDGNTLTVKNGSIGEDGVGIVSISIAEV